MRQCCYCGKELKDNRQWCPHCMRHQQEPKRFENTPVERDVRRTLALRVTPCCLTVSTAVLLSVVLVSSGFRSPAPSEVVVPTSESDAPVVLTEPEITTDPAIVPESEHSLRPVIPSASPPPASTPPVLSPTTPAGQAGNNDNTFQEVEMNFFAQEVTKYLQKKYPKNLIPTEKFSRMEKEYITIPKNTIPADNWRAYIDYSLYHYFFHDAGLGYNPTTQTYSVLCQVCMDSILYPPVLPNKFDIGQDITDVFPGSTRPAFICEFAIEYIGLTDDGQKHLFAVYTFLHRPCLVEENFNSIELLEIVKQALPEYTWIDSFTREDFPFIVIDRSALGTAGMSSDTESVAEEIIRSIKFDGGIKKSDYYDIFLSQIPIGSQQPGEHGGDPDCLAITVIFYQERKV